MIVAYTLRVSLLVSMMGYGCATSIAEAGYIVSDPIVRNLIVYSGLGQLFRTQAGVLYDLSGFRMATDQGVGKREASTRTQNIVEVNNSDFSHRHGTLSEIPRRRFKRDHPLHDQRDHLERLFGLVHKMDGNTCISRMICEVGSDKSVFGMIGRKLHRYLASVPPVTWNSSTYAYVQAYEFGSNEGSKACSEYFNSCPHNLENIARLFDIFTAYHQFIYSA